MKDQRVPDHMRAAVWRGGEEIEVEKLPVPETGPGEILVRVHACGICPTDIKKLDYKLLQPPVVLGHETSGEVAAAGPGCEEYLGKRVALYHHVPCRKCRLCELGLYSQCEGYKRTGTTAGFTPAGGGWAEYVRVFPWILRGGGVVEIPRELSLETAVLMEPLNTCLKCVRSLPEPAGKLVVLGQGPVGLTLSALASREGWEVFAVEPNPDRRSLSYEFGVREAFSPGGSTGSVLERTGAPLGPDAVIAATDCEDAIREGLRAVRFGGTVLLFAHTRMGQLLTLDAGEVGKAEKRIIGSYSSSIELNGEVIRILLEDTFPWRSLVTAFFPLSDINRAVELARKPEGGSLKTAVKP